MRTLAFVSLVTLLPSLPAAAAGLDFQIYGGSRTTTFEPDAEQSTEAETTDSDESLAISDKFSGVEVGVSALVQPLPLVPFAFGAFALQQRLKGNGDKLDDRITGLTAGAEAMAWLSFGVVQPFARVGYDLYSSHKYTATYEQERFFGATDERVATKLEMDGRVRGYHGAAGLRFRPTPVFGAFLQADFAKEQLTIEKASITQDGSGFTATMDDAPKVDLDSRSFMVGVEIGT